MTSYQYPEATTQQAGITFTKSLHKDTYAAINSGTNSDLKGKSVLITGASKGVGKATAISYASTGASHIILAARSDQSSLEDELTSAAKSAGKEPPQVIILQVDVTDPKSVDAAKDEVEKRVGKLDILINNAGYLESWKPIADTDLTEWWKTFDVNIRGVWLVTRAFLPLILKGEMRTIVNISSIGAHRVRPQASAYQMTKFAIMRFSEFICSEYCDQGVVSYSVHPGGVPTELAKGMPKEVHGLLTDTPELAGDWLAFMTQERRTWMAGRYFSVNWDVPELLSRKEEIVQGDKLKMRLLI